VAAVDDAVAAIRAGKAVILPTDTVYGVCVSPYRDGPVRRLYRLKQRPESEPIAIMAADLELLFDSVPELRGSAGVLCSALLPGPFTLVVPNPARRYRWLTGGNPEAIGVRVPELNGDARTVLERVGVVAATSANHHGGADPRTLDDVPPELRAGCAALVDGSELPGTPSTVLDLTGSVPRVVREGAVPAGEALERAREASPNPNRGR
jgi:L-threonylcarbamoyladenylate synthase